MQNVDELKTRVEETTEKIRAFQEGRNGQSQSLVEMLGELEEKYAAQSVELEYCRDRIDPLETANTQLALLMESLLDTIDAGFANIEGDPLQKAAEIAGSMLVGEMSLVAGDAQAEVIVEEEGPPDVIEAPEELLVEEPTFEEEVEDTIAEDIELAEVDDPAVAEIEDVVASEDDLTGDGENIVSAASELSPEDVSELLASTESEVQFEDVSEAALELEAEEDAPTADLPEPVVVAIADTEIVDDGLENIISDVAEELVSYELVLEEELEVVAESEETEIILAEPEAVAVDGEEEEVATADDLESVAALAQEIEEEAAISDEKPAASDIRALLERVEALAAKAGAMGGDILPEAEVDTAEEDSIEVDEPREAGAAA